MDEDIKEEFLEDLKEIKHDMIMLEGRYMDVTSHKQDELIDDIIDYLYDLISDVKLS